MLEDEGDCGGIIMNNQSFYRKITYAVCATVLLLPISFIARPASYDSQKKAISNSSVLSQMRQEKNLSLSSISEVDSTSEIMKLGSLGLHGIACNLLWNQAQEYERVHAYDRAKETIETLIKLQPHFVNVWEFQAHNLSYNISREFDDYEDRYYWVKEGIDFLIEGIPFNKRNKKIFDNLGLFSGQKLGRSDEQKQFRELFRHDTQYHQDSILGYFDSIDKVKHVIAGVDNWLWAKGWYEKSYKLVEQEKVRVTGELLYYSKASSQLRNFADSYMKDFPPSQFSQDAWKQAHRSWVEDYGRRTIHWQNDSYTHEGQQGQRADIEDLRKRLDECAPGIREKLYKAKRDALTLDEKILIATPMDLLSSSRIAQAQQLLQKIAVSDTDVAKAVPAAKQPTATGILRKLAAKQRLIGRMARDRQTVNYDFWRTFTEMASTDKATQAWAATHRAKLAQREANLEDYEEVTEGEDGLPKSVKKKGSISHRIEAMALWKEVLQKYPQIAADGSTHIDDLVDEWKVLHSQITDSGLNWPTDFPLQPLIDERSVIGYNDGIPTTDQMRAEGRYEKKEEADKNQKETLKAKSEEIKTPTSDQPPLPTGGKSS